MIKNALRDNPLFLKDASMLTFSTLVGGFFVYLLHFFLGRELGPADYGLFNSFLSINYISLVFLTGIQFTVVYFVSKLQETREYGTISFIAKKLLKILFVLSVTISVIFMLFSPLITKFLHTEAYIIMILLSLQIIVLFLLPVMRGLLQGTQNFFNLGISIIIDGVGRCMLGALFILLGYGVEGAMVGVFLGYLFSFLFTFYPLKKIFTERTKSYPLKRLYHHSFFIIIMLLSITLFYSLDLILVRHYLASKEVGLYSVISLFGKMVFFALIPISFVMFPKVTECKKEPQTFLYKSLALMTLLSIPAMLVYFIFPKFIIKLFFGAEYLGISSLIGPFSIFMVCLALIYNCALYNLAVGNKKIVYLLLPFNILEVLIIIIFHSSILEIVTNLLLLMSLLLAFILTLTCISIKRTAAN